jgi:hypothetical protein
MNQLFCFSQDNNISNVIGIEHYGIQRIVLIEDSRKKYDNLDGFKNYLRDKGYQVLVKTINHNSKKAINAMLTQEITTDSCVLLPSNATIIGYQTMATLFNTDTHIAFVDNDGDLFEYQDSTFVKLKDKVQIDVEDFILSRGGFVKSEATTQFDDSRLDALLEFIETHHRQYKNLLSRSHKEPFFSTEGQNNKSLLFMPNNLSERDRNFLYQLIDVMYQNGVIRSKNKLRDKLLVRFSIPYMPGYLLKAGTWLEHRLYKELGQLNVEDLDASMNFVWDSSRRTNNECDVMGVYNNKLIIASCKDTKSIKPEYLNEVYAIANHLGNTETIKILFTTAKIPESIQEKAQEFNIHVIQYTYHSQSLQQRLTEIIY